MADNFKNTTKQILKTEKNEEDNRNNNICWCCEKNIEAVKGGDECHLTGKYREPAHSECDINVTQKQSNFIPVVFSQS